MNVEWKIIPEFEGRYKINSSGEVLDTKRNCLMPLHTGGTAKYLQIVIWHDKKSHSRFLHRLLAQAFIPNPKNLPTVNHKDGNKLNNSIDNLEWATYAENNKHARAIGLNTHKPLHYLGKFGKDHNRSKAITLIETGEVFGFISEASRKLGLAVSSIHRALTLKIPLKGHTFQLARI